MKLDAWKNAMLKLPLCGMVQHGKGRLPYSSWQQGKEKYASVAVHCEKDQLSCGTAHYTKSCLPYHGRQQGKNRLLYAGIYHAEDRLQTHLGKHTAGDVHKCRDAGHEKVLVAASVASMIDQFNMPNIRLLQEMGYEVHVACNYKEGNTCDTERIRLLQETLQDMHVVQHQWDCPRSIWSAKKCVRAYRQLLELTDRYCFSWMHCHSPIGGALARMAAHKRGIRIIYTAHGFHFYRGAPLKNWLLYYPAEKLLAHWTDILITVNREDYFLARRRLKAGRVCYIPGAGIDTGRFRAGKYGCEAGTDGREQEKRAAVSTYDGKETGCIGHAFRKKDRKFCRRYRIPEGAAVLLSVGELNEGKNHRMVIDALAELSGTDIYYLVCGQGTLRAGLMQHARSLGVGGRLRLPGFQEDMPFIYQNADIFVFPSRREGMPAALMEAMAAGLPCVASDIRGNRELVEGRMLFSLERPGQLVDRLEMLLQDARLREECGRHAQTAVEGYDQKIVLKRMQKIYQAAGADADHSSPI